MTLLKRERISRLGRLGEDSVAERLRHRGYTHVENLNGTTIHLVTCSRRKVVFAISSASLLVAELTPWLRLGSHQDRKRVPILPRNIIAWRAILLMPA
jgi:hypothetical protein